ncbi:MAG: ferritin-like domain-containing protein [Gemmatimonadota bacterium]
MSLQTLEDLFIDSLKDLYSAEKQLIKALPRMAKAATSPDLKRAFEGHLAQTRAQVTRIEKVFKDLEGNPGGKKCMGMEGLIEEGKEVLSEAEEEGSVLDAGLIAAAQKVEHYEIAAYGTAREWAQLLGYKNAAKLLQQTLDEEAAANEKLTSLAADGINENALE